MRACHCTDCQRHAGSAFVLNAIIETSATKKFGGRPLKRQQRLKNALAQTPTLMGIGPAGTYQQTVHPDHSLCVTAHSQPPVVAT